MFITIRMCVCVCVELLRKLVPVVMLLNCVPGVIALTVSFRFCLVLFSSSGKISICSLELDHERFFPVTFQTFIHSCPLFRTIRSESRRSSVKKHQIHTNVCCYGLEWPMASCFPGFLNLICRKMLRLFGWGIGLSQDYYLCRRVEKHRKPRQILVSGVRTEPR